MKELAPRGAKFFRYRVGPFQKGTTAIFTDLFPLKEYNVSTSL